MNNLVLKFSYSNIFSKNTSTNIIKWTSPLNMRNKFVWSDTSHKLFLYYNLTHFGFYWNFMHFRKLLFLILPNSNISKKYFVFKKKLLKTFFFYHCSVLLSFLKWTKQVKYLANFCSRLKSLRDVTLLRDFVPLRSGMYTSLARLQFRNTGLLSDSAARW